MSDHGVRGSSTCARLSSLTTLSQYPRSISLLNKQIPLATAAKKGFYIGASFSLLPCPLLRY